MLASQQIVFDIDAETAQMQRDPDLQRGAGHKGHAGDEA